MDDFLIALLGAPTPSISEDLGRYVVDSTRAVSNASVLSAEGLQSCGRVIDNPASQCVNLPASERRADLGS